MSRVMFHDICDHCGAHSAEYSPWYHCRECEDDVCPQCASIHDDETATAVCKRCADPVILEILERT